MTIANFIISKFVEFPSSKEGFNIFLLDADSFIE